ncbi:MULTISPECIES: ATP-dependent endonuclease [unclassified Microbacterium]|uniref:ATP-dependent endonuclease n=1 Tax=unclassified Microbacterium TaxID=2609290 RepID=UPI00109BAD3D|nr:ATP-dependent endonuclease [Microbacterium sp. K35]MBN6191710.1 hypothetical protein [Aneurinibacillus sp. BA2021]
MAASAGRGGGTVVLFEGASDRLAFLAAAQRLGETLDDLDLVDLDGITNLRSRLAALRAVEPAVRVLGLYDAAEGAYVTRVLRDDGAIDATGVPADAGFFGCERDLEDEVIRAAGVPLVEQALAARGELGRFRVFQGQPAQRGRVVEDQLHRFAGTAAGRKARFAADIVGLLPLDRMPPALSALLDAVRPAA